MLLIAGLLTMHGALPFHACRALSSKRAAEAGQLGGALAQLEVAEAALRDSQGTASRLLQVGSSHEGPRIWFAWQDWLPGRPLSACKLKAALYHSCALATAGLHQPAAGEPPARGAAGSAADTAARYAAGLDKH